MAQTQRISGRSTSVNRDGDITRVRYHNTDVVVFSKAEIRLNSGGYRAVTTKTRMNQTSNQYGLGYAVFQKDYSWFVAYRGQTMPFRDHLVLTR